MKNKNINSVLFILISCLLISCQNKTQEINQKPYTLVWSDEFKYTGLPDPAKWEFEEGYYRRPQELQYYTVKRLENARVDGEHLIIEVRKETPESFYPTSINDEWHRYTSANVNTRNTSSWLYGRFEIRAKLPKGPGMWPALWFLSPLRTPAMPGPHQPKNDDGTPTDYPSTGPGGGESRQGEIDLMEAWGTRENRTYTYVHGLTRPSPSARTEHTRDIYNEFHIYAMEWFPDRIDFYRDDVKTLTVEKKDYDRWPFDKPFYLLMNIAVAGPDEPAPPDEILPQQMVIDYVRVYQWNEFQN